MLINESTPSSEATSRHIRESATRKTTLMLFLDATIGLNKQARSRRASRVVVAGVSDKKVQFRINVNDLALLRSSGIDPTRKVKTCWARRIEPLRQGNDE